MNNISSAVVTRSSATKETQIIPFEKTKTSDLVDHVKKWITVETELKKANENVRQLRESKHELTSTICHWMKSKEMPNRMIRVSDGEMRFYEKKEYSPLTYGYLEKCLSNIIQDKSHIEFIMKYLKENREITVTTDIRHVVSKK